MKKLSAQIALLILCIIIALSSSPFCQTKPKSKRNNSRRARNRNNRAGRDKEKKTICPEDLKGACPGAFSLVYGFIADARPRRPDGTPDLRRLGMAFNVYVTPRIFLEVDNDHFISQKAVDQPRVTGFGDTVAIVGIDAVLEGKKAPGLSLNYSVKAPTASVVKGLGSGEVDQQLTGIVHKTVGRSYWEYDAGVVFAKQPDNGYVTTGVMSGIWQQSIKKNHLFHLQLDATLPNNTYKGDLSVLSFWQYSVTPQVAVRFGGLVGVTSNAPRAGVYLAFVFEDNLRRILRR